MCKSSLHAIDDVPRGLETETQQLALLLSDPSAYMFSADKQLKFLYIGQTLVVWLISLHDAAAKVKADYEAADNFISRVTANTVKNSTFFIHVHYAS